MSDAIYNGYFWQGEKIRLRPLKIEDAEKKRKEWTDSEARILLECGMDLPPISPDAYKAAIEEMCDFKDTSRFTPFGIETLDEEFVGWINLFKGRSRSGTFSFGISVFREYRKMGYAEEAVRILLRYGFYELRMQKCNSVCLDFNEGSIKLHKKLGFREEGRRRRNVYTGNAYHDEILFGLLKEEFEANDAPFRT